MGDIAEMMLEGILCEGCGVALIEDEDDEVPGYPRRCAACARDLRQQKSDDPRVRGGTKPSNTQGTKRVLVPAYIKVNCPDCNAKVRAIGLDDHMRDKHGVTP